MARAEYEKDLTDLLSRYNVPVMVSNDPKVTGRVNAGIEFLERHLAEGNVVYGECDNHLPSQQPLG
jgi:hypothetical protein